MLEYKYPYTARKVDIYVVYTLEQKQLVIKQGYHLLQKRISKYFYKHELSIERQIKIQRQFSKKYADWELCFKVNNARYQRTKRIRERLNTFIYLGQAYLLTLTFTDDVLSSTSYDTRRQYVRRYLSKNYQYYFANIDFGETNNREHYHATVDASVLGVIPDKDWPYGFIDIKPVRLNDKSPIAISKYQSKLSNHAIKNSGRMIRIIYSRK